MSSVKGVWHTPLHAFGYEEGRCSVEGIIHTPLRCTDFSRGSLFNCVAPLLQTTLIPLTFPALLMALGFGVGIGLFYFGGLWWTTQQVPYRRSPALWLLGSFALRTVLAVGGFYLVMQGRPERLLVCLFGFLIARFICVRTLGQIAKAPRKPQDLAVTNEPQATVITNEPQSPLE